MIYSYIFTGMVGLPSVSSLFSDKWKQGHLGAVWGALGGNADEALGARSRFPQGGVL